RPSRRLTAGVPLSVPDNLAASIRIDSSTIRPGTTPRRPCPRSRGQEREELDMPKLTRSRGLIAAAAAAPPLLLAACGGGDGGGGTGDDGVTELHVLDYYNNDP